MPGSPNIPARLKAWRKAKDLTQETAATKLGVNVDTLRGWEQGRHAPRGLALSALLTAIS
jgi:DNA-binding transcriptional regulator YiaG